MAMEMERQREVGERIKELRGPRPQPHVADQVGVTLRAYQAWEAGESGLAWANLRKLAEFFGVSENYLLYGSEEPAGPSDQLQRIEEKLDRLLAQWAVRETEEADELDEPKERASEEGDDESDRTDSG